MEARAAVGRGRWRRGQQSAEADGGEARAGEGKVTGGRGTGDRRRPDRRQDWRFAENRKEEKLDELLTSDNPLGNTSPSVGDPEHGRNVPQSGQPQKLSVSQTVTRPGYHNDFPALSGHAVDGSRIPPMVQSYDKEEKLSQTMSSNIQPAQSSEEVHSGNSKRSSTVVECENSHSQNKELSFDICEYENKGLVRLKAPLLVTNKAARNEKKRHMMGEGIKSYRTGMILLKGYLSLTDQVKLIKKCRDLGRGPGGFYQPGYRDGATIHLKMMCLGKHWEPETGIYCDKRSFDGAETPSIPVEFLQFVHQAIQGCHAYLESEGKNARSIIPSISPNICIINFYTKTGKLGLHQDKDESQESLHKGLPVVSFSIGDTAEFLYGDDRDIDKAGKVDLESGDVLIFGGDSRNIFHGVSSISPNTAPKDLIKETNLKAGRLNLTFREY